MEMDVISINSDSEDEAVPPPTAAPTKITTATTHSSSTSSSSESATILCEPSSAAMQALTLSSSNPALSSHSQLQAQGQPSATSNMDFVRRRRKVTMKEIRVETHFPVIKEVNMEFRAIFGVNYSQSKVMKIIQSYIRCLRALQEVVHKYPNKCGLLSKNVSRSMLLLRGLSKHFSDTPYYLQKICELLAIYIFLELRFATAFTDSKIRIAERIITNINLHMESVDFSYVLRIFAYIPYMGKESEIVSAIFQKIIPEPVVLVKNEFYDRLYIQYLIAFYHWKDAEAHYDDQQKVIAFASRFMKPKHSLKSSLIYARHLPSYVKREDATSYFLNNLVFFNDLRTASLLDGVAANLPSMIDLSDDLETLSIDYAEISEDQPIASTATIKLEEQQIVATVDLTDIDDDAPWLTRLVRKAVETEVKLPRIMTAAQDELSIIDLDSSDDENWVFDENDENVKKNTSSMQITTDCNSNDSFRDIFNQLNTSMDLPDDSTSDALLKELAQNVEKRVVAAEESTQSQTNTSKETRITFEGITEIEFNSMPITSTANPETVANIAVPLFGEDEFHEVPTATKTNHSSVVETILKDFSDMPSTSELSAEVCENVLEESNAPREAVTLNTLNLETFPNCNESSEEYSDACLSNDNNAPLKTYLKKFFKTPETNVSINLFEKVIEESERSNAEETSIGKEIKKAVCLPEESKKKTPNVLFSGKVIPLREDENIGGLTPSYLKVPESVVVSSHGSNVVFSMQGRRLSSFPPLEVTSSSELTVPDFDTEYSLDGDDTIPNKSKGNTTPKANTVFQVNSKQNGSLEIEKPTARRRNVRFSDKNDVHEIAARETMTSPDSPAAINNITSTINKINGIKQQYQQSTTATTPSTISTINTNTNNKNTTITPPSTSLRRIFPTLTLPPLSETAALKTAQEQDLVHQLFPELFAANSNKSTKKKTNAGYSPLYSPARPPSSPNPFNTTKKKPSRASSTITSSSKPSSNNNSTTHNDKNRSKSVTPVPGKQLSEFDKYLQNLKNRRAKTETKKSDAPKRGASRRLKKINKSTVNSVTKSLVDITNDPKLSKMRPIVLVERLSEAVYKAKMHRQVNLMSECDTPMGTESRTTDLVRPLVSTAECLVKIPGKQATVDPVGKVAVVRSETKSLSDILTDVVEREIIAPICKDKSSPLHEIEMTLAVLESEDTRMRNANRQVESLSTVVTVGHSMREEVELKPQVLDTSKSELKAIKTEVETESEVQPLSGSFKKPLRNATSRTLVSSRFGNGSPPFLKKLKTPPPSPARIDVAGTSQGFLAGRLEADMTNKNVNYTDADVQQSLPNTNVCDCSEPSHVHTMEAPPPMKSKIVVSPKRQVKVRLKRFNFKDSEEYIIVYNTALDDFNQEQSEKYQQIGKAQDSIVGSRSENEIEELPMERKRRVRRSTARKEKALKKNVISSDKKRQSGDEENNLNPRLFNGTAGHNIESISTPPPTPPSPTGSPVPSSKDNNTPANSDETSQNSNLNAEPNNNRAQSSFPPINTRPNCENMLSNYIASNSVIIQEFRRHVNMPPEVEIDTNSLSVFYKYLLERNDIVAMETVHRLMPLLKTKVFGSLASSAPQLRRKRVESCTLPSLILRRTRKFSSSEVGNESSWSEGTWSTMPRKRRKTICSDRQYFNRSPDFMHCKEISSSTKPADSPTVEVKGQHTDKRGIQPIPTLVSSKNSQEDADGNITAGTVQSPHHFSDSSSPALGNSLSSGSTPAQSEIYECAISSASMRSICESPPDVSHCVVVSRTYSKDNMVQHVFVPPEIEKCIEEQSSIVCTETSPPPPPPTTTKRQAACSANYLDDSTSQESGNDNDDDSKDEDYNYKAERKVIRSNKKGVSKFKRRGRCSTKTNTQRRKT